MLSAFLGITDKNCCDCLRRNGFTEVGNLWIPCASSCRHVEPRTLCLQKLHRTHLTDRAAAEPITLVSVSLHYSTLPLQLA